MYETVIGTVTITAAIQGRGLLVRITGNYLRESSGKKKKKSHTSHSVNMHHQQKERSDKMAKKGREESNMLSVLPHHLPLIYSIIALIQDFLAILVQLLFCADPNPFLSVFLL